MSYWSEVKELFLKGVDLALANFKDTAESAIGKGKDGVVYVQLKKDLFIAHRELQNYLSDLGDTVNEIYKSRGDIYSDEKVQGVIDKIASSEAKCKELEKKIKDLAK
ncbi:MAG TPA: hypothetical protein P5120_19115 [Spirochaetota bacterium]|nr:hypothetical protein [Spirochaetota bacterium]